MKNIFKLVCVVSVSLLTASCAEEYLDTVPTGDTSPATVFESTDNAKLAINGICKLMTVQYLHQQGFNGEGTVKLFYGEYPGDEFVVNLSGWSTVINSLYHDNTTSLYDYYPWYYYYGLIGNANTVIMNVEEAAGDKAEKDYILAQALTFRAYSYSMLTQFYCKRWSDSGSGSSNGLPLRIDQSSDSLALSTLAETYAQIYSDLDKAISLYTSSGIVRDKEDNYSPDIHVAYATYARTALCKQDYQTAADMAAKARDGFPLMGVDDYKSGFSVPTSEWIWSSYGSEDETLYYYQFFSYMGYNASSSATRKSPKRIEKGLFEKIPATDIRKAMFLDPQGESFTESTGAAGKAMKQRAFTLYPDLNEKAQIFTYMQFKFKNIAQPGVGNLNHFRSSEMYLIEAEADYFLSKPAAAKDLLEELTAGTGRDESYKCTATGGALLDKIKFYRRVELWGEGFNWFDLKRWGDTLVRKGTSDGGNYLDVLAVTIKPEETNGWVWAIPQRETNYNPAI